ncbi:hypothetical protein BCR44DRAFT_1444455, partial [Catenaria anguillulae PL171]
MSCHASTVLFSVHLISLERLKSKKKGKGLKALGQEVEREKGANEIASNAGNESPFRIAFDFKKSYWSWKTLKSCCKCQRKKKKREPSAFIRAKKRAALFSLQY